MGFCSQLSVKRFVLFTVNNNKWPHRKGTHVNGTLLYIASFMRYVFATPIITR